jgi:P27 family predicted phage terminase small subunit
MTPNAIKAARGTETYNAKTGTTTKRDSGGRAIKETVDSDTIAQPPKTIKSKREKELWNRIISAMPEGVYTALDESLLAAYVHTVIDFEELIEEARKQPVMIEGSMGQQIIHPARKAKSEQAVKIASLGARLGLDPIARNSINAPSQNKKSDSQKDFWGTA